VTAFLEGN